MRSVSAKELKNRTGGVLRRVGKGENVLITRRGKPWAVLSPYREKEPIPLELREYEVAWKDIEKALKSSRPHFRSWKEAVRKVRGDLRGRSGYLHQKGRPMYYGWRGKIGHVCPAIYDTGAYEFEKILPEGVITVTVTLNVQQLVVSEFERAAGVMIEAAKKLADEDAGVVIAGGDPIITMKGVGSDQEIIAEMRKLTGKPASTTITAAMDGLRAVGAKRIAIASPYTEERNLVLKKFMEGNGFEVAAVKSLGIVKNVELTRLPFHTSYQLALEAFRAAEGIQGIYLPCARWPVVGNLRAIEEDTGASAVSSIQSMAWFGLKSLGIREKITGYGKLLEGLSLPS